MEHICRFYIRHNTNKLCSDNDAIKCEHFQVNKELEERMLNVFHDIETKSHIEVWSKGNDVVPTGINS